MTGALRIRVAPNPPSGTLVASRPPPLPSPASVQGHEACEKYRQRFRALKRRFYFEHEDGGKQIFALDLGSHARFHAILRSPDADAEHLRLLIEAINRSYCPHHFEGDRDHLYLWIGHRLDEQPTKSFVAGECIPYTRLEIRRPEPPGPLKDAFAYVPDHLILAVTSAQSSDSTDGALRIDAALFPHSFGDVARLAPASHQS